MNNSETTCDDQQPALCAPSAQNAPATAENAQPMEGKPMEGNRGGAPRGNQNRTTSGLRGSKLPKGAKGEEAKLHSLRKLLRGLVAVDDKVSDQHELTIQAAMRHEMTALLAIRWLRLESDGDETADKPPMALETRLNLLDKITRATEARDKVIAELGLKPAKPAADGLPAFYREGAK